MRSHCWAVRFVFGMALLASAVLGGVALAQSQVDGASQNTVALPRVEVSGLSAVPRELKTLNQVVYTQIHFDRHHKLAPQAELKFKVFARKSEQDLDQAALTLIGKFERTPVVLDQQHRFALDPAWRRLDGNTELRSRLPEGRLAWRTDIRTPGLPPNTRRLGDLRLECMTAGVGGLARRAGGRYDPEVPILETRQPCLLTPQIMSYIAERPVFGITLVHGERRVSLNYFQLHGTGDGRYSQADLNNYDWGHLLRNHMFRLPEFSASWPDDALVVLEFMDSPDAPTRLLGSAASAMAADGVAGKYARCAQSLVIGTTRRSEVEKQLGRARVLRFQDGRETWHYFQFRDGSRVENLFNVAPMIYSLRADAIELLLLFNADGVLEKFALREDAAVPID